MRLRSHTVVFERDPEWSRFHDDPSGKIVRILQLWWTDPHCGTEKARHFLGNIRYSGGWMSRPEVSLLYRRITAAARLENESGPLWRGKLSQFLRGHIHSES